MKVVRKLRTFGGGLPGLFRYTIQKVCFKIKIGTLIQSGAE